MKNKEFEFYEEVKNWSFDEFEIETEDFTLWDLYDELRKIVKPDSKVLDLGTGGGEKVLKSFPDCAEIVGTDYSPAMIETANENLKKSGRKNIVFKVMDNLNMTVADDYFDVVVARNTVTDPAQIYKCLKKGGYLLIRGVDKDDCHALKMMFGRGQGYTDKKPISIIDYENVINAGFKDAELIPIHEREYFKNRVLFKTFLEKVPILDSFSEEELNFDYEKTPIDDEILDDYINDNTYDGKIRLLRRYYGIVARKK